MQASTGAALTLRRPVPRLIALRASTGTGRLTCRAAAHRATAIRRADMAETVDAWVALGANLGERRTALTAAFTAIAKLSHTRLIRHSSLWASPPLDADGPDYLNAVALLQTSLDPFELLDALQSIELTLGRTRSYRNAPRTLDLDLLLHGRAVLDTPTLTLPHPRMATRAFVLRPLAELAPDLDIPGHGTVRQCLAHVADQPCEAIPETST